MVGPRASSIRLLVTNEMPARTAARRVPGRCDRSPTSTRPAWTGSTPATPRPSSVIPAPARPTRPSTSPRATDSDTGPTRSPTTSSRVRAVPESVAAAVDRGAGGVRPTMSRTTPSAVCSSMSPAPTRRPSRSTAMSSAISKTSSRRWET